MILGTGKSSVAATNTSSRGKKVASKSYPKPTEFMVLRLRQEGESYRSIKEQTGLALATITRIVKER